MTKENLSNFNFVEAKSNGFVRFEYVVGEYLVVLHVRDTLSLRNQHHHIDYFEHHSFNLSFYKNEHYYFDDYLNNYSARIMQGINSSYLTEVHQNDVITICKYITGLAGKNTSNIISNEVKPCSICGMKDKWNGPSAKHGGSIRCYQHC